MISVWLFIYFDIRYIDLWRECTDNDMITYLIKKKLSIKDNKSKLHIFFLLNNNNLLQGCKMLIQQTT